MTSSPLRADGRGGDRRASRRVVSQTVGTDELLLALADPPDRCTQPPRPRPSLQLDRERAAAYPKLKSSDAESVIFFRPDLVLAASYTEAPRWPCYVAGVALIVVDRFESFEDVYANIRGIGAALAIPTAPKRWSAAPNSASPTWPEAPRREPVRVLAVSTYHSPPAPKPRSRTCAITPARSMSPPKRASSATPRRPTKSSRWNPEVLIASTRRTGLEARLRQIPRTATSGARGWTARALARATPGQRHPPPRRGLRGACPEAAPGALPVKRGGAMWGSPCCCWSRFRILAFGR